MYESYTRSNLQYPSTKTGRGHLAAEALSIDGFWDRKSEDVSLLRDYPCFTRWLYIHAHTGITE